MMWVAWVCLGVALVANVDYSYSNMEETVGVGENLEVVVELMDHGAAGWEGCPGQESELPHFGRGDSTGGWKLSTRRGTCARFMEPASLSSGQVIHDGGK